MKKEIKVGSLMNFTNKEYIANYYIKKSLRISLKSILKKREYYGESSNRSELTMYDNVAQCMTTKNSKSLIYKFHNSLMSL